MGQETKIEWCHYTFNPWVGCTKVSAECKFCYAEASMDHRLGFAKWGDAGTRRVTSEANWKKLGLWDRAAGKEGVRRRVFCASLADIFEDRDDLIGPRNQLFSAIHYLKHLDILFLTKRPENIERLWPKSFHPPGHPSWGHIWLGTSVGVRETMGRIDILRRIPGPIRFLSIEPLLEDLGEIDLRGIDWVIVGGESGPHARPCNIEWIWNIVVQCKAADVPAFVKQLGSQPVQEWMLGPGKTGKIRVELADSKGGNPAEWQSNLRVRQFPR